MKVEIGCDNCQTYEKVTKGSNAHKANLCHGCFHDMKESTIEKALRHRFNAHGIPYDEIDPEMIEMLDVINFEIGLKTKFCCYGHKDGESFSVMFHESVTDEQIMKLAEHTGLDSENTYVTFSKWVRWHPIDANWIMESGMAWKADSVHKKAHLDKIVKLLRKYEV